MLDELTMVKDIIGDLSSVGGWVVAVILAYKLLVNMVLMVGGGWLAHSVIGKIFVHLKADISKDEAENLKIRNKEITSALDIERKYHRAEMDEVKMMCKVLKEANKNVESA